MVTSVPFMPMATPISASFTAGASLTPSPVMATMWPFFFKLLTILSLWRGVTRAKTAICSICFKSSLSLILSSSWPVTILLSLVSMESSLATAQAVDLWSPVIITGLIPAVKHFCTAEIASGLGGSMRPIIPTKVRSFSKSESSNSFIESFLYAKPNTLNAFRPISSFAFKIFPTSVFVIARTSPRCCNFVQRGRSTSGAPLVNRKSSPFLDFTNTDIRFLSESKGISLSRVKSASTSCLFTLPFRPAIRMAISVGSP